MQSNDPCDLFDVGRALVEVIALIAMDCALRDHDLAAWTLDIGDAHDLREAPSRLLLVGIQVLPKSAPATGLPGLLLHRTRPVSVETISSRLEFKGNLLILRKVFVEDILDLVDASDPVRPRHVTACSWSPLFVRELTLFVRFGREGFEDRRRVHAVLHVLAKFLDAFLVVPSQADVHAIGLTLHRMHK